MLNKCIVRMYTGGNGRQTVSSVGDCEHCDGGLDTVRGEIFPGQMDHYQLLVNSLFHGNL